MYDVINDGYFEWLFNLVCNNRFSKEISYRKLLINLHYTEFTYLIPRDKNRAEDGINLRHRFILMNGYEDWYDSVMEYLDGPCSVLEMMIALAIKCEEIMDDPKVGDRTGQWFWGMIVNLGLGAMTDDLFDEENVDDKIRTFLNRDYEPDGTGGLFTNRYCGADLRGVEIWYQMCWYLDTIT